MYTTIYFIKDENARIKIGRGNVQNRLRDLQVGNAEKLTIVASFNEFPECFEKILHYIFRRDYKNGEWFKYSEDIKKFLIESSNKGWCQLHQIPDCKHDGLLSKQSRLNREDEIWLAIRDTVPGGYKAQLAAYNAATGHSGKAAFTRAKKRVLNLS